MARDNNRPPRRAEENDGLVKKLIAVNRVSKTVKGGRNMRFAALVGTTIPHEVIGKFGRGSVLMKPAEEGTGVIAGGPVRAVMEAVGITNIRTKSHGTNNPINCVKAAIAGLKELRTAEQVASLRGKTVEEIIG